jgi:hypothetical protein
MRSRCDLERLFLTSLSIAAAACAASAETTTEPSSIASQSTPPPSASSIAGGSGTARPTPTSDGPKPDETTPEGYAMTFRAAGPFSAALSGLTLMGFADVVDGALQCEGETRCPDDWQSLVSDQFQRAAVVKKSRTLATITQSNFFEWVGPVDSIERAALRARIEPFREITTCAKFAEAGFSCAPGSDPKGIPVKVLDGAFEVATYGQRNICGHNGKWGNAEVIGVVRVNRQGEIDEVPNVLTDAIDKKAQETVTCHYPRKGRHDASFRDAPRDDPSELAYLERAEREEAAAVLAFERLARELEVHGAPASLVASARRSANDERRHAALFRSAVARRSGERAAVGEASVASAVRSLREVLLENAREGCANEAYAAVVATHQGLHAPERMRGLFASIARDEQEHARLAYAIHAWGRSVVDARTRAEIDAALDRAVQAFAAGGATSATAVALGEPGSEVARAAFERVVAGLSNATLVAV